MNKTIFEHSPHLSKEWDYDLNSALDPNSLSYKSQKKASWICTKNPKHKWDSRISSRTIKQTGCLFCLGKMTIPEESFAAKHQKLLEEWDWDLNKERNIDPWAITTYSNKVAGWICSNNPEHKWNAAVYSRAENGTGCKKCNTRKSSNVKGKDKSLATNFPELAQEWDTAKNFPLTPEKVTYGSAKEVWWVCKNNADHIWKSRVANRTGNTKGSCPHCSGVITNETNSLVALFPDVAKEWHPTKNAGIDITTIKKASGKKVWWLCSKDESHVWEAQVRNRTTLKSGCPDCDAEEKSFRLNEYLYNQEGDLTDHFKVFRVSMNNAKTLISSDKFSGERQEQIFFRLVYSNLIAILESYLSDTFSSAVLNNKSYINSLFLSVKDFSDKKYSIHDAVNWQSNEKKIALKFIHEIVWHNLPKAHHLYKNVLKITLPQDDGSLMKAISKRHDIVHRNGKNTKGRSFRLEKGDLITLLNNIDNYVREIEKINRTPILN